MIAYQGKGSTSKMKKKYRIVFSLIQQVSIYNSIAMERINSQKLYLNPNSNIILIFYIENARPTQKPKSLHDRKIKSVGDEHFSPLVKRRGSQGYHQQQMKRNAIRSKHKTKKHIQ